MLTHTNFHKNIFLGIYLPVCPLKEVQSWSHTSWVKNDEIYVKNLPVCTKTMTKRKKSKTIKAIGKLFVLHAKTIVFLQLVNRIAANNEYS